MRENRNRSEYSMRRLRASKLSCLWEVATAAAPIDAKMQNSTADPEALKDGLSSSSIVQAPESCQKAR